MSTCPYTTKWNRLQGDFDQPQGNRFSTQEPANSRIRAGAHIARPWDEGLMRGTTGAVLPFSAGDYMMYYAHSGANLMLNSSLFSSDRQGG